MIILQLSSIYPLVYNGHVVFYALLQCAHSLARSSILLDNSTAHSFSSVG